MNDPYPLPLQAKGGEDTFFPTGDDGYLRHTTDFLPEGPGMQSILDRNDLGELMAVADLQGREFAAERHQVWDKQ